MLLYCLFLVLVVLGTLGVLKGASWFSNRTEVLMQLRIEQKSSDFRIAYSSGYVGKYQGFYIYDPQGDSIRVIDRNSFEITSDPRERTYFKSELKARKMIQKMIQTQESLILNGQNPSLLP